MGEVISSIFTGSTDGVKKVKREEEKFAEGRFRNAIIGTWIQPASKCGEKCVIKHFKESYTWEPTDWDTTVQIYKEASELAEEFNKFHKTNRVVSL